VSRDSSGAKYEDRVQGGWEAAGATLGFLVIVAAVIFLIALVT
jgi:hypothetical protein